MSKNNEDLGVMERSASPAAKNSRIAKVIPTGKQVDFETHEIIVSKTDLAGKIKYANDMFVKISGYSEAELMGAPHNILRHPDMPRAIYYIMWERLGRGKHVFNYVINLCKNGDHYWVMAHICPSFDADGNVVGYHSSRRKPDVKVINESIIPLYKNLLAIEASETSKRVGLEKSFAAMEEIFRGKGVKYNEFILSL